MNKTTEQQKQNHAHHVRVMTVNRAANEYVWEIQLQNRNNEYLHISGIPNNKVDNNSAEKAQTYRRTMHQLQVHL